MDGKQLTIEQIIQLVEKVGGYDSAMKIINSKFPFVIEDENYITHTFNIFVNEMVSVESLLKDQKFDWKSEDIASANFPLSESGQMLEKELVFFHFNRTVSSDVAVSEMGKADFRPGSIWDLLSLSILEKDFQKSFPIIALQPTQIGGVKRVSRLTCGLTGRYADLRYYDGDWEPEVRFLAVRNPKPVIFPV